ncbi:MAG TPA: hypothetical protein VMV74_02925 [Bacteroidales bacterium]|nr:hypothetical protein [Bacteroidales bacterium]
MENRKFSLEIKESNKITRVSEIVFGLLCLAGTLWFAVSLQRQATPSFSSWLAIAFLALFGVWEILSGAGLVSKYITIGTHNIMIRHLFWKAPVSIAPSDLAEVRFKYLTVEFGLKAGKTISVRLGTYYSERSAEIMEAVENFCVENNVMITGERNQQGKQKK